MNYFPKKCDLGAAEARSDRSLSASSRRRAKSNSEVVVNFLLNKPLTPEEENELLLLESKIERAFYEAGTALKQIRDRRLYRATHVTFEAYCLERFGYNRRHPYLLIEAAKVVDNIESQCDPMDRILPTNERQVRPLTKLNKKQQVVAWKKAVVEAGNHVPSGRIVRNVVRQLQAETIPNLYQVGEVCQIVAKDNPELTGKGGYWCLVGEVHEYSCMVNTWEDRYLLPIENLKSCGYSQPECQIVEELNLRMIKLYKTEELDEAALWILKGLAKIKRPYLTEMENKLLSFLEAEYL